MRKRDRRTRSGRRRARTAASYTTSASISASERTTASKCPRQEGSPPTKSASPSATRAAASPDSRCWPSHFCPSCPSCFCPSRRAAGLPCYAPIGAAEPLHRERASADRCRGRAADVESSLPWATRPHPRSGRRRALPRSCRLRARPRRPSRPRPRRSPPLERLGVGVLALLVVGWGRAPRRARRLRSRRARRRSRSPHLDERLEAMQVAARRALDVAHAAGGLLEQASGLTSSPSMTRVRFGPSSWKVTTPAWVIPC